MGCVHMASMRLDIFHTPVPAHTLRAGEQVRKNGRRSPAFRGSWRRPALLHAYAWRSRVLWLSTYVRMQHDELIWQLIHHGHCSFKSKYVPTPGASGSLLQCEEPDTFAPGC
jgi:hypothetical protein